MDGQWGQIYFLTSVPLRRHTLRCRMPPYPPKASACYIRPRCSRQTRSRCSPPASSARGHRRASRSDLSKPLNVMRMPPLVRASSRLDNPFWPQIRHQRRPLRKRVSPSARAGPSRQQVPRRGPQETATPGCGPSLETTFDGRNSRCKAGFRTCRTHFFRSFKWLAWSAPVAPARDSAVTSGGLDPVISGSDHQASARTCG